MGKVVLPIDAGEVSDGHHTFSDLYNHRMMLFAATVTFSPYYVWRSQKHSDGTMFPGMFVAGIDLPAGQISYHFPIEHWDLFSMEHMHTLNAAPHWDGYDSFDVLDRLKTQITGV